MDWTRSGGGSLGFGVGAAIGAKIAVGRERPVVLHLGDGALGYSASGFWTMARYNTAILTIVSNNESYQVVRHNWAREMPDSKMIREGKYPGLWLSAPATDYVGLARSQGVDGEAVTTVKDLEPALRRGMDKITRENRPYLIEVSVAREGIGADSTWYQDRSSRATIRAHPQLVGAPDRTLNVQRVRLASHQAPPRSWTLLSRSRASEGDRRGPPPSLSRVGWAGEAGARTAVTRHVPRAPGAESARRPAGQPG